jgi:hypothetical protein
MVEVRPLSDPPFVPRLEELAPMFDPAVGMLPRPKRVDDSISRRRLLVDAVDTHAFRRIEGHQRHRCTNNHQWKDGWWHPKSHFFITPETRRETALVP